MFDGFLNNKPTCFIFTPIFISPLQKYDKYLSLPHSWNIATETLKKIYINLYDYSFIRSS